MRFQRTTFVTVAGTAIALLAAGCGADSMPANAQPRPDTVVAGADQFMVRIGEYGGDPAEWLRQLREDPLVPGFIEVEIVAFDGRVPRHRPVQNELEATVIGGDEVLVATVDTYRAIIRVDHRRPSSRSLEIGSEQTMSVVVDSATEQLTRGATYAVLLHDIPEDSYFGAIAGSDLLVVPAGPTSVKPSDPNARLGASVVRFPQNSLFGTVDDFPVDEFLRLVRLIAET